MVRLVSKNHFPLRDIIFHHEQHRDTVFPTLPIIFKRKVLYQPDGDEVIPIVIYFCIYLIFLNFYTDLNYMFPIS